VYSTDAIIMPDRMRILYVDDETALLDIGKLFLERTGDFSVTTIGSTPAALAHLKIEKFDAIISDYQMPEMDGITFLKQFKASGNSTPFIIFTGRGREEVVIEALNSGADFYIQKGGEPKSQFADLSHKIRQAIARKRAEEALTESEARYRNVVETQTEFICRFLPDGTFIFVNDAFCRFFEMNREDLVGHRFRPRLHPEDREIVARHIASITPEHPVVYIDQRIVMPDGSTRWQRWSDRALFDPAGRVVEYQSVGWDIMEQKEIEMEMKYHEQELMRFSTSLDSANKKLNLLYSITRHDINNQLTVLQGYSEILEMKQPDTRFAEYFQKINASAQRIFAMIQFTREYESIGIRDPVWQDTRTLVNTVAKDAPLGMVMVKNDLPGGNEVLADPLIAKVFYNLMDNAVRYGGKITTIRFSVGESGADTVLLCEDDGDGVLPDEKEKIFERGFGKNTGLGLALSREILAITGIVIQETGEPGKIGRAHV
jgi:PAS domain S-box-containing protein